MALSLILQRKALIKIESSIPGPRERQEVVYNVLLSQLHDVRLDAGERGDELCEYSDCAGRVIVDVRLPFANEKGYVIKRTVFHGLAAPGDWVGAIGELPSPGRSR